MNALRQTRSPLALLTCVTFLASLSPVRHARADEGQRSSVATGVGEAVTQAGAPSGVRAGEQAQTPASRVEAQLTGAAAASPAAAEPNAPAQERATVAPSRLAMEAAKAIASDAAKHPSEAKIDPKASAAAALQEPDVKVDSLPLGGGDKSGATSQAISLPQGSGKIEGMGESFSTQMQTGVATFSVPFSLIPARGGAQPSLTLSYSSASGHGIAGVGWEVGVPFIARQTDRGLPKYNDPSSGFVPDQDRFVFNGGQELIPICTVAGAQCSGALAGEQMPPWAENGTQYFRPRVEGSFLRFFWSADHRTWRVQSKSGTTMELGVPLDNPSYVGGIEADPSSPSHIFRWNLVREYDAYGDANPAPGVVPTPVNVVVFRYLQDGNMAYLQDIYDTPPVANTTSAPLSAYAHHVRLVYQPRPDATLSFRHGWQTMQAQRLTGVDVTSQTFGGGGARNLVRRYHLAYDPSYHVSLLTSVQIEGRCFDTTTGSEAAIGEDNSGNLPASTGCPTLPAMTFGYSHVAPFNLDGSQGTADLTGYEGFDERMTTMAGSPPNSIDENVTDFFDVNADSLPDVIVTRPGSDGRFPLYINGSGGKANTFEATTIGVQGVLGATSNDINLINSNVAVADIDGDGKIDWLHQPAPKVYSVYTPQLLSGDASVATGSNWVMAGREVAAAALQDPHLDLGEDTPDINVVDANGDGLVDVVRTTGRMIQTFFALGRYPGGDGNFGSARWTGPRSAELSLQYVPSCVPLVAPGEPVRFSDKTIRMADMNGDGLQDIVYVKPGDIRYWPGRGDGSWGTGTLGSCTDGFAENTYIAMKTPPEFSDIEEGGIRIDDVNGDGLDDLVQVRFDAVDIWLNVDGTGWTPNRHVIQGVQPAQGPLWAKKVRTLDINGSGTRDILWGEANNYRYMDLSGGNRPWLLTHVANGLGKTTDIEYDSSTNRMLGDALFDPYAGASHPWRSLLPMPVLLVTKVTEHDNLNLATHAAGDYVKRYTYWTGVYDGRQREYRGFYLAREYTDGDGNNPTSVLNNNYYTGACSNSFDPIRAAIATDPTEMPDPCTPAGAWQDNPHEALKGLFLFGDTIDATNIPTDTTKNPVVISSKEHTYRLRKLYAGLDGRGVYHAFESISRTYQYDTANFVWQQPSLPPIPHVEAEYTLGQVVPTYAFSQVQRTMTAVTVQKRPLVDYFGNTTDAIDDGCASGCTPADESITTHTMPDLVGKTSTNPAGTTGWMYRTVESYVNPGQRNHKFMQYDGAGSLTQTSAVLQGTLPLDRFHQTGAAVAPAPPGTSQDSPSPTTPSVVLSTQTYDGFGQLVHQAAPNSRCRDVTYDTLYDQLPVLETTLVGAASGACGGTPLHTIATYDRGLGAVLSVLSPRGELTVAQYDSFGRSAALFKPDPATVGKQPSMASVAIEYFLPTNATVTPYSILHTSTQNGTNTGLKSYQEAYAYVDGLGRTIATLNEADPMAGDGGAWIVDGLTDYDKKGTPRRKYLAFFWSGDPKQFPLGMTPPSLYGSQRYDPFSRPIQTLGLDGTVTLETAYHALSADKWDAADLMPGPHQGTPASVTQDGHGRTIAVTERIHNGKTIEARDTRTTYLSTGEPAVITRVRVGASDAPVVRWMQYDSLGRMVLNVEPDTTVGFNPDPSASPSSMKAWRYAYNNDGDLVGTSDARGCGANYHYDAGGRIQAEDFSPCLLTHAPYSVPNLTTGDGTEAFYFYDGYDPDSTSAGISASAALLALGRLALVADRGAKTASVYDGRGRVVALFRRLVQPGTPSDTLSGRYAPKWYGQTSAYDVADRPVTVSTGVDSDVPLLLSPPPPAMGTSQVTIQYSKRGTVSSVGSSYGPLVSSITRDADGPVTQIVYGDGPPGTGQTPSKTTSAFSYDARRRLSSVQTYRGPPTIWSTPPASYQPAPSPNGLANTFQLLLEDTDYIYDDVDNPIEIRDWRNPAEWPAGALPVTRKIQYDDLYRATQVTYASLKGAAAWTSPFSAEDQGVHADPRRAQPSPHVAFVSRVQSQSIQYDWLGNTVRTDDDLHGFYDRSLGTVANGTASAGPYQLQSGAGSGALGGSLTTAYDPAGNLTSMAVTRAGPCLPTGAICSQRFAYDWDEVGRLVHARRWDTTTPGTASSPLPTAVPSAELRHAYDATDERTLKTAIDATGNTVYDAYILGSLELRRTTFTSGDYLRNTSTEVAYLSAHGMRLARLHYALDGEPTESGSKLHVLLELPDHLGSASIVIDHDTSELVERGTYMANGGPDSDYRPGRWNSFREDYRFTGKEEDIEVGLEYFGKRFKSHTLNRFVSADPLAIQGGAADPNVYGYVHGQLLRASDPTGLDTVALHGGSPFGGPQGVAMLAQYVTDRLNPSHSEARVYTPNMNAYSNSGSGQSYGLPFANSASGGTRVANEYWRPGEQGARILVGFSIGGDAALRAGQSSNGEGTPTTWDLRVVVGARVDTSGKDFVTLVEKAAENSKALVIVGIHGDTNLKNDSALGSLRSVVGAAFGDRSYEAIVNAIKQNYGSMAAFYQAHPNVSVQAGEGPHGGAGNRPSIIEAVGSGISEIESRQATGAGYSSDGQCREAAPGAPQVAPSRSSEASKQSDQ